MSSGCVLLIFRSKGKGHNALISINGLCHIIALPLHLLSWNFTHRLPMSLGRGLLNFRVKRSRPQCIYYWKWFMLHNSFAITSIIMKIHTQTPHELRVFPVDFGVQRSRSQCIDYWKWLLAHHWFPFINTIMKLHTQTPHQSTICPYTGTCMVKTLGNLNWLPRGVFVPLGQSHSSLYYQKDTVYFQVLSVTLSFQTKMQFFTVKGHECGRTKCFDQALQGYKIIMGVSLAESASRPFFNKDNCTLYINTMPTTSRVCLKRASTDRLWEFWGTCSFNIANRDMILSINGTYFVVSIISTVLLYYNIMLVLWSEYQRSRSNLEFKICCHGAICLDLKLRWSNKLIYFPS